MQWTECQDVGRKVDSTFSYRLGCTCLEFERRQAGQTWLGGVALVKIQATNNLTGYRIIEKFDIVSEFGFETRLQMGY